MNSKSLNLIITEFKKLKSYEKEQLLIKLFTLSKYKQNDINSNISCPFCNSIYYWKNGKLKDRQRYLCKKCGRSFNIFTNTPVSYSKKDLNLWLDYSKELISQTSLRKCSKKLGISLSTAFFWRHKILDAISENKPSNILKNEIQVDETYFNESFKGNHSRSEFKMPRAAYKRGSNGWFRGMNNKKVCVLAALDSNNSILANTCCIGHPTAEDLLRLFKNNIKRKSVLITDSHDSYKKLSSILFLKHKELPSAFYSSQKYNMKNINIFKNTINNFIKVYRGVATKYLQNYLDLLLFIDKPFIEFPIFLKGNVTYRNVNFKGRPPIFS